MNRSSRDDEPSYGKRAHMDINEQAGTLPSSTRLTRVKSHSDHKVKNLPASVKPKTKPHKPCDKKGFKDEEQAKRALRSSASARSRAAALGTVSKKQEIRYYECTLCPMIHLTSLTQEDYNRKYDSSRKGTFGLPDE